MNSTDFAKTKLIFDLSNYIATKRNGLLEDLVAYTEDPVRYGRRIRLLRQLAQYESSVLQQIENFNTADDNDIFSTENFDEFKREIDTVASTNT